MSTPMLIAWRSLGWISQRVVAEESNRHVPAGLSLSWALMTSRPQGWRYSAVVVDRDTCGLVSRTPAGTNGTIEEFLDLLGTDRWVQAKSCRLIRPSGPPGWSPSAARTPSSAWIGQGRHRRAGQGPVGTWPASSCAGSTRVGGEHAERPRRGARTIMSWG